LLLGYPNDTTYLPDRNFQKMRYVVSVSSVDTVLLRENPLWNYAEQNQDLSKRVLRLERSRRVPGLVLGGLNQGTENTPFTSRLRFGITVPIWQWTYQSQINSAKKGIDMAGTQKQLMAYQLSTEYAKAVAEYRQYVANLDYFNTVGLQQSSEVLRNAKESFRLGSITYYIFLQNIELSYTIRQNYLETLKNYNQSVLTLMFLRGAFVTYP
ncbi:MAG: TolC family protein, partial [Bacteroidetes bacterium]|nr:TolC family protein [Bacteroidota bacterium]